MLPYAASGSIVAAAFALSPLALAALRPGIVAVVAAASVSSPAFARPAVITILIRHCRSSRKATRRPRIYINCAIRAPVIFPEPRHALRIGKAMRSGKNGFGQIRL
jgi:hypothetical protein